MGLLGLVTLAGCGPEVDGQASPSSPSSTSPSPAAGESTAALGDVEDLSAGLLPAEAFGPGVRVTPTDPAAFAAVLQHAFEQQADTLD